MANQGWRDQRNKMLNLAKSSRSSERDHILNTQRNMRLIKKVKEMKEKENNEKEI